MTGRWNIVMQLLILTSSRAVENTRFSNSSTDESPTGMDLESSTFTGTGHPLTSTWKSKQHASSEKLDATSGTESGIIDIWLIGLFPRSGSWAGGLGQLPAVEIGIEDVNADPTILPGYRLRMEMEDTQCDAGIGTNALYRHLYSSPTKILVLGAGCSAVSQATAQVSHLWNLIQISYSSASPALSNKSTYPRFFRVFPPESSFNAAKFALLDHFKWQQIGALYEARKDSIFDLTTLEFLKDAQKRKIKIVTSESFIDNPRQQVRNLKKQGVRIIIGNFYENSARVIFCEAYKEGMYGSKYVWIITGFYSPEWWKIESKDHDCTVEQLEEALQGYFTADALPLSLSGKPGISGKTYQEFIDEYKKRTNNTDYTGHQEAPYGYDSVWTVAAMLNASVQWMRDKGWGRNIEHFNYNDTEMAELFWNLTSNTSFEGVSGPVLFDDHGDRRGLTQIEQLQGNVEVRVGVYDPSSLNTNISWDENHTIIWKNGAAPPDSISEKITPRVITVGLFILMTGFASFGIVLTIFFLIFNIRYRHSKYIKMSSPNMNNIILLGAMLAFSSIIFGGTDSNLATPDVQLLMCKFYNWTLALGFSLAFGAMFSKTWRVHKIFTNKKIGKMVIKDYQLMAIVFVLVLLDVFLLTVWEFIDPLRIVVHNKTTEHMPDPNNDNQILIPQSRFCESSHMWYFAGIFYAIKGLLLLFGAFLAYETRKVTVPALNDSKFIGISVWNVLVLCLIGVPTAIMIKDQVDAAYMLISLFTFFATILTIGLVFIPKAVKRNREPQTRSMWLKAKAAATAATATTMSQWKTGDSRLQGADTEADGNPPTPMSLAGDTGAGLVVEKMELDQLREDNRTLREALKECRRRLQERDNLQFGGDLSSPQTTQSEDLTSNVIAVSNSMPSLRNDRIIYSM